MAVDFRCEHCGKSIGANADPGASMRCPHCQKMTVVPTALASLPRPLVPKEINNPTPTSPPPPAPVAASPQGLEEEVPEQSDAVMNVMARAMPLVLSVFFHVGLGMVMIFLGSMFAARPPAPEAIVVPDASLAANPGNTLAPPGMKVGGGKTSKVTNTAQKDSSIPSASSRTKTIIGSAGSNAGVNAVFAVSGSGSAGSSAGGGQWFGGGGGSGKFFGVGGTGGGGGGSAYHFVFVIDRSGSMADTFEGVKNELITSVSKLGDVQDFHVVLLGEGAVALENTPRKLVPATKENKEGFLDFIEKVVARGGTNPIPALTRAFDTLDHASSKPGKVIYLLTDGAFSDNEKVLALIRDRNKKKDVFINTFLYAAPKDNEAGAAETMKKIASENHGLFKQVDPDE